MTESQQLLADYLTNGSEGAFRELVTRYMDLVYATALRLVDGDTHRAEDVAQTVFVDLARQARKLSAETMLGGWLHRHTCFVAGKVRRGERRRQLREKQAVQMNAINDVASDLAQIAPLLDEAIDELGEEDRRAILLRFYERRDLRSVGKALGSSENAAQKRISRALGRLQFALTHRGAGLSATALAAALASGAVTAAPTGLATSVAVTALASATAGAGTALTFFKLMTMTKLKVGLAAIVLAGLGSQVVLQRQSSAKLHVKDQMLQQQNDRIIELAAEAQRLSNLVAGSTQSLTDKEQNELARLRAEVGALKRELIEARQAQPNIPPIPGAMVFNPGAFRAAMLTNSPTSNYAKALGLAFRMFANDNEGQFPTNFDQVETFISASQAAPKEIRDLFELVNLGSSQSLTNPATTIIVREKQPREGLGGLYFKTYVFADGHIETQSTADGKFESWEQMHSVPRSQPDPPVP